MPTQTSFHWVRVACTALFVSLVGATAQTANAPGSRPSAGEPVTLSVFEVSATNEKGYAASTAMSGTRTNEKL
ncbi:MAG: hypothetical protein RLZZ188_7 [Verrucomicrobiota bacterium]|jgi:hypothetical protein